MRRNKVGSMSLRVTLATACLLLAAAASPDLTAADLTEAEQAVLGELLHLGEDFAGQRESFGAFDGPDATLRKQFGQVRVQAVLFLSPALIVKQGNIKIEFELDPSASRAEITVGGFVRYVDLALQVVATEEAG